MDLDDSASRVHSPWSPFRHKTFSVIWTATLVANIGGWMYSSSSGWLMTTLDADPMMVSLVQVASNLPLFLFAVPAGALADIVDKRRFLIVAEIFITIASTAFAVLVWFDLITPVMLLLFVFLIESGTAATSPPWQSIVPQLIPKPDLPPAVALNSISINISRALGPALGGVLTAAFGLAAPFWVNAVSNLGTIGALAWWRSPQNRSTLPAERFASGISTGLRYARHNSHLRATLVRAVAFYLFASCYWALLPLVARDQIGGGAKMYGALLGAIGVSAIAGSFALPWMKAKLGPNRLVAAGSIGTAGTLILLGSSHAPLSAIAGCCIAGMSWIVVLASLNLSAQFALAEWVRGRGLAIYVTVFFGSMTIGSVAWGEFGRAGGVPLAHFIAAAAILLAIPLTWRWKLQTGAAIDLTPSAHWPSPVISEAIENDSGPVLVTVEYRIDPANRAAFLRAIEHLSQERGRDGAYAWGIYEDTADRNRYLETFLVESWLEHLRQHKRVTNADRLLQDHIHHYLKGAVKVTHFVAPRTE